MEKKMEQDGKWWQVEDKEVEDLVKKLGGSNPFRQDCAGVTVVPGAVKPPRPRVSNSPRPPVRSSPTPRDHTVANSPRPQVPPSGLASEMHELGACARGSCPTPRDRTVANSPRPHVAAGTPLMTHRSMTPRGSDVYDRVAPRSRPASARRRPSSASHKNDGKITVYVQNMHSFDKLVLRVCPDLLIGDAGLRHLSGSGDPAEVNAQPSLKNEIAQSTGIDASQIRLMFHGTPLGDDEKTLKCFGIIDGETVQLRVHRDHSCAGRNDVVLACAAKKHVVEAERDKDEMLFMRPYAMQSPEVRTRVDQRVAQGGAALMPKWVSQDKPKLFAPVGVGFDGHGGGCYEDFNLKGIWTQPVDHPNQRVGAFANNQYALQRVREGAHAAFRGGA